MFFALPKQLGMILGRALRESGQALDRVGCKMTRDVAFRERYSRHRKLFNLDQIHPTHGKSFIAPNSTLIGEVQVGNDCSVLYGAVLRGDLSAIRIDDNVHIGENSVLHTVKWLPHGIPNSLNIAKNVVIGPGCILSSCLVDSDVWIQAGAVVQQGGKVEKGAILLPGAVVGPGNTVQAFTVYGGYPARFVRDVNQQDLLDKELALKEAGEQAQRNHELLKSLGH